MRGDSGVVTDLGSFCEEVVCPIMEVSIVRNHFCLVTSRVILMEDCVVHTKLVVRVVIGI